MRSPWRRWSGRLPFLKGHDNRTSSVRPTRTRIFHFFRFWGLVSCAFLAFFVYGLVFPFGLSMYQSTRQVVQESLAGKHSFGSSSGQVDRPDIDHRLVEPVEDGFLPTRSVSGLSPLQVYRAPSTEELVGARVYIIVTGVGLSRSETVRAIDLPPAITLGLSAYARDIGNTVLVARARGHEILIELPLEPRDKLAFDSGPFRINASDSPGEKIDKLHYVLQRATGYIGLYVAANTQLSGTQLSGAEGGNVLDPVMLQVQERGLLLLDSRAQDEPSLRASPRFDGSIVRVMQRINFPQSEIQLQKDLQRALDRARGIDGEVVLSIRAQALSLRVLSEWVQNLDQGGSVLAPLSEYYFSSTRAAAPQPS